MRSRSRSSRNHKLALEDLYWQEKLSHCNHPCMMSIVKLNNNKSINFYIRTYYTRPIKTLLFIMFSNYEEQSGRADCKIRQYVAHISDGILGIH